MPSRILRARLAPPDRASHRPPGADIDRLIVLRDALAAAKDPYWTEQVNIQRQIADGLDRVCRRQKDEGLRLMRAAADAEDATDKAAISPGPIAPGSRTAR